MYALEAAMDELAIACGIDPIELRIRNDPDVDPDSGRRFSSRNLVACLRKGAERFDWSERDPRPGVRREGRWLIGSGVASSTYPARRRPSTARARYEPDGGYTIQIAADEPLAKHGFGAQFVEVRVDIDTGEVGVSRALGVFATGRIINAKTARSQFIGGMTMGIGMALHEESVLDVEFGDYLNHDLAGYHVPSCADIEQIDAIWVDEDDPHVNPMGAKGIGEIGIVGTAAAVANAVYHAAGVRVRDLPIRPEKLPAATSKR